jgi:hypothetical protein
MKTLDLDVRFLAAGNVDVGANPLQNFVSAMSLKQGRITAKLVFKVLALKGLDSNVGTDLCLATSEKGPSLWAAQLWGAFRRKKGTPKTQPGWLLIPLHQQSSKTILAWRWDAAALSRKLAG